MCHLVASSQSALSRIREVEEGSSRDRKSEEFGPGVTAGPIFFWRRALIATPHSRAWHFHRLEQHKHRPNLFQSVSVTFRGRRHREFPGRLGPMTPTPPLPGQ